MAQSLYVFGTHRRLAGAMNLLAARSQVRGPVVFIDPIGVFDAEYVMDVCASMANIMVYRPRTAYQFRTLLDRKLLGAHDVQRPFLVVVSCVAALFDLVEQSERAAVVDYAVDVLHELVSPKGVILFGSARAEHDAAAQVRARCDLTIDMEKVRRSAEIFK